MVSLVDDLRLHTIHRKVGIQMANRTFALNRSHKQDIILAEASLNAFRASLAVAATQAKMAIGTFAVENRLREGAVGICINCGESISDTDEVAEVVGRFTTSHKVVHVECIKPTDQLA